MAARKGPADEPIGSERIAQQLADSLGHQFANLFRRRRFADGDEFVCIAHRVGRDEARADAPRFVDVHQRAATRTGLARTAALRRAGVLHRGMAADRGAAMVIAPQRPEVDAMAGEGRSVERAVGDREREQAAGVGMKVGRVDRFTAARASAEHLHDRNAFTEMDDTLDMAGWKTGDVLAEVPVVCPALEFVSAAAGPIDGDAFVGQPRELFA